MFDRVLVWLSAGVVTAGVSMAMVAGAGLAVADDGSTADVGSRASSESSNSSGKKPDPDKHGSKPKVSKPKVRKDAKTGKPAENTAGDSENDATKDQSATGNIPSRAASDADTRPLKDPIEEKGPKKGDDHEAVEPKTHQTADRLVNHDAVSPPEAGKDAKKDVKKDEAAHTQDADVSAQPEAARVQRADPAAQADGAVAEPKTKLAAGTAALALATPQPTAASPLTSVINAIGNFVFEVLALVTNLAAGPPVIPPGSTVTVSRSTLQVGGKTVTADWYFPHESEPPTGLIYFQHGAFAVGSMYSYTAADLAEQTNSIVVAPTMSTNGFAPDGMWLGGAPLQTAVADLFLGNRNALTASASAAAGHNVTLPEQFVLAGHSLGGVFVTAVAGYLADDHATADLKGVVLFDPTPSAGQDSVVPAALAKLPADLPVYLIGSPPSYWNEQGSAANALATARSGKFVGVILDAGSHADSLQGGNPLIQFIENLVSGFPRNENIAAAQILASGWINDMFHPTHDGIYSSPGDVFTIDTPAGTATAYALPDTHYHASPFQLLLTALIDFLTAGLGTQGPAAVAAVPPSQTQN